MPDAASTPQVSTAETVRAHIAIARLDHSIKNLFVLPVILVPLTVQPGLWNVHLWPRLIAAFISITLIACSNYVINEVLDAPFDRLHPIKKNRPAARGLVSTPLAYVQWVAMMGIGMLIAVKISHAFAYTALFLWVMGCFYNFPPIRTKDVPYLDVLTESVNNPLRMLLGWFAITSDLVPPLSLLLCYWMIGCYFMALKRFSELSEIEDRSVAAAYRTSFRYYTPQKLLACVMFYGAAAMLFLGAFSMRYRPELILSFPVLALTMAVYFNLAFEPHSAVQNPEKLYREPKLMASFLTTFVVMIVLLLIPLPKINSLFAPTLPSTSTPAVPKPQGHASVHYGNPAVLAV